MIDDGTLCRSASPSPSVAGHHSHLSRHARQSTHNKLHYHVVTAKRITVPSLHIGSHGPDVEKLQRLLNSRLYGGPRLKVDGRFGLRTQEAVVQFQKNSSLVADGIVGRKTWFCLASAPVPRIAAAQAAGAGTTASPPFAASAPSLAPSRGKPVAEWPLEERFEYVLHKTLEYLAPDLRDQFKALVTGKGLAITVGTLVIWAAGHFFGVSEVVDAFLLGAGAVFLGKAAIDAARYFKNFLELTCTASSVRELDEAASDLSKALVIVGITTFVVLLAKVARIGKGPKSAVEEAPETELDTSESKPAKKVAEPTDPVKTELEGKTINGIKPVQVRPGTNGRVAVIGRGMGQRVGPYAQGLKRVGYDVETFEGDNIPVEAKEDWARLQAEYEPDQIPDDVAAKSKMFEANKKWAEKLRDQGYTVVDIGTSNPTQGEGPFFAMERDILFR